MSIYGAISPLTDGNSSPTQSTGTSQNPGHTSSSTQDRSAARGPAFNGSLPSLERGPGGSSDDPLSDESRPNPNLGDLKTGIIRVFYDIPLLFED